MKRRLSDIVDAFRRLPDRRGWERAAIELAWCIPLMLLLANAGGLVRPTHLPDAGTLMLLAATLFVAPALGEELLFRVLPIPRHNPALRWQLLSVALFVAWHPLQALTVGPPWAGAFLDPWFLAAVAVLGAALARIYAATGSIWPTAIAHWLVVLVWKALLGGPF